MVVILAGIAERVLDGFFDRTGDARVAVVDGVAAAGALGDDFDGRMIGYGPSSGSGNPVIIFERVGAAQAAA